MPARSHKRPALEKNPATGNEIEAIEKLLSTAAELMLKEPSLD